MGALIIPLPFRLPADLAYLIRAYSFRAYPHRACPHRADLDFGRAGGRGAFGAPSGGARERTRGFLPRDYNKLL